MVDFEGKYTEARAVLQRWVDAQGHDRCWYYPELFTELVRIYDVVPSREPSLPKRDEFERGCKRYQEEEYRSKE